MDFAEPNSATEIYRRYLYRGANGGYFSVLLSLILDASIFFLSLLIFFCVRKKRGDKVHEKIVGLFRRRAAFAETGVLVREDSATEGERGSHAVHANNTTNSFEDKAFREAEASDSGGANLLATLIKGTVKEDLKSKLSQFLSSPSPEAERVGESSLRSRSNGLAEPLLAGADGAADPGASASSSMTFGANSMGKPRTPNSTLSLRNSMGNARRRATGGEWSRRASRLDGKLPASRWDECCDCLKILNAPDDAMQNIGRGL